MKAMPFKFLYFTIVLSFALWSKPGVAGYLFSHEVQPPASFHLVGNTGEAALAGAQRFVDQMAQEGITYLSDRNLNDDQRRTYFKKLLDKNFDIDKIARFSLGRYWRGASKAQQKEYTKLFKVMIVDVYARRFSEYQGQILEIKTARPEGTKDIMVSSILLSAGSGPDVDVEWRVRQNSKGRYKIIDIIVAGVSMAMTQRSDFASVIQRGGGELDVLIAHLETSK